VVQGQALGRRPVSAPLPAPEMLRELGAVLASDEYQRDPLGSLQAWAAVASGRVTPDTLSPTPLDGDFDGIELAALALAQAGPICNGDVRRALGAWVSDETVRKRLARLCERGLLERRGRKRATRYVAASLRG